jgi:hypothetical protein
MGGIWWAGAGRGGLRRQPAPTPRAGAAPAVDRAASADPKQCGAASGCALLARHSRAGPTPQPHFNPQFRAGTRRVVLTRADLGMTRWRLQQLATGGWPHQPGGGGDGLPVADSRQLSLGAMQPAPFGPLGGGGAGMLVPEPGTEGERGCTGCMAVCFVVGRLAPECWLMLMAAAATAAAVHVGCVARGWQRSWSGCACCTRRPKG